MSNTGNYKGNLKAIKGDKSLSEKEQAEIVDKLGKDFNEAKQDEETPKKALIGFNRVADELRKKLAKFGSNKGISSFSVIGKKGKFDKVPVFSGGMVGNPEILVEGLFNMAIQRPEIKALLTITVNALNETEILREIGLAKLHSYGKIKPVAFNVLNDMDIFTLKDLCEYTEAELLKKQGIGGGTIKDLKKLLTERGLAFKA